LPTRVTPAACRPEIERTEFDPRDEADTIHGTEARLQQLFLPEGIAFDENRFHRTSATAPFFKHLAPDERRDESLVSQTFASWNPIGEWLRRLDAIQRMA
jgi:hypothetical protein